MQGSVPSHMGPDPRGDQWAYYFFSPFSAFLVNQVLSRLVAFAGMFLLVRALLAGHPHVRRIALATAVLFSLINNCPPLAFTVPVLPWITYSVLQVYHHQDRWWDWAVLCFAPFVSFFFCGPFFILIVLGVLWLIEGACGRKWDLRVATALAVTGITSVIASYDLVLNAFAGTYVSQRSLWPLYKEFPPFVECIKIAARDFIRGHYAAQSHHQLILILVLGTLAVTLGRRALSAVHGGRGVLQEVSIPPGLLQSAVGMLLLLLGLAAAFSLWLGLSDWEPIGRVLFSLPKLSMIQLNRFYWLHPLVWYLALAYVLAIWTHGCVSRAGRTRAGVLVVAVFAVQASVLVLRSDYVSEWRAGSPTFRQFFAERQFAQIADFIGLPQESYRVVSVGMHPSIALYNGFYCLDGYLSDHSLEYHLAFRRIVAPELERSESACKEETRSGAKQTLFNARKYFDWGIRCYLFSSELSAGGMSLWTRDRQGEIERLDINRSAFLEMGGRYILSAVPIRQAKDCGLRLLRVFDGESRETAWQMHLYEVLPTPSPAVGKHEGPDGRR